MKSALDGGIQLSRSPDKAKAAKIKTALLSKITKVLAQPQVPNLTADQKNQVKGCLDAINAVIQATGNSGTPNPWETFLTTAQNVTTILEGLPKTNAMENDETFKDAYEDVKDQYSSLYEAINTKLRPFWAVSAGQYIHYLSLLPPYYAIYQ